MKKPNIQSVVFDVDGMLLDTHEFIMSAFEVMLARFGHPVPPRSEMATQMGRSLEDCYIAFAPNGDIAALCVAHDEFQRTSEAVKAITAYPGVVEMLHILKDAGLKLAVFSSRKTTLVASLEYASIADFFEVIIQGNQVSKPKPHPEGVLKALGGLQGDPRQAAMIGDAAFDILAGKAAHVALTVGITHGFGTQEELETAGADYIVAHAAEIPALILGK